jgi:hypothetical protein
VGRIARAAWRLERAERMEGELFGCHCGVDGTFGRALIRDGHGARAFETLLRYRGGATAELWRALRTLKALQADAIVVPARAVSPAARPNEPERRRIAEVSATRDPAPSSADPAPAWLPPGLLPPSMATRQGRSALLAGTALAPGRRP